MPLLADPGPGAAGPILGSTLPRVWTAPLVTGPAGECGCGCALSRATSYGFEVDDFARDVLGAPLDPWQRWLAIHGGELLPNGRPRFRRLIVIVARQNGKTHLLVVLALYWQFIVGVPLVLGTSTKLDYAKESWLKSTELAESAEKLARLRPAKRWKRDANGEQESWTLERARYKIAAANDDAGRSLTVHRLICDELRQHKSYRTWNAAYNAMNAVRTGQAWGITNMGDDTSIVLNDLREAAAAFVTTGEGDARLGLFEWSCEPGADPLALGELARANPNLGRRLEPDDLLGQAVTAVKAGGDALVGFKTEVMCIKVANMRPALDPIKWAATATALTLDGYRTRVAMVLDVAPDLMHATLYAGAIVHDPGPGGLHPREVVLVDLVHEWSGDGCTRDVLAELPALLARTRPRAFGWLPSGPAAALAAALADRTKQGRRGWPPPGVTVSEIKSELPAVCMGMAQLVDTGALARTADPLLAAQGLAAEQLWTGNVWVFSRRGGGHVDAVYAAAGAAHLARTLPTSPGSARVVVVDD